MMPRWTRSINSALFVAAICTLPAPLCARPLPAKPESPATNVGIYQQLNQQLPLQLNFADEQGRELPLQTYFHDRPVILCLVYYQCPMLCNQVLNGLVESLRAIDFTPGKDYELVVVSFDPTETPQLARAKKHSYVVRYARPGAEAGWHFLTGSAANIDELAKAAGFQYRFDERSGQFAHASGIMLATPQGRLSRYFYGIDYPTRDLRLALVESSSGKIGSPVDAFLLLCFHYDPLSGKYGVAISNVLRGAGTLTAVSLLSFVCIMLRRERAQRRAAQPQSIVPATPSVS